MIRATSTIAFYLALCSIHSRALHSQCWLLDHVDVFMARVFMLSLVKPHHYYQNFLSQGVGMGIGMGLMFLPSLTIVSHYFRAKRSLAMGVVIAGKGFDPSLSSSNSDLAAGSSLGGCLYPILLNNLFHRTSGFAVGVR